MADQVIRDKAFGAGSLYRIDERGAVKILSDVSISNGLDWSPDATIFYFIDSLAFKVSHFSQFLPCSSNAREEK